jgi:hypothetical protein
MTILARTKSPCTLILLPSAHVLPPPPKIIGSSNFSYLASESLEWSQDVMNLAQKKLFDAVEEQAKTKWQQFDGSGSPNILRKKGDVGEGGMYI